VLTMMFLQVPGSGERNVISAASVLNYEVLKLAAHNVFVQNEF